MPQARCGRSTSCHEGAYSARDLTALSALPSTTNRDHYGGMRGGGAWSQTVGMHRAAFPHSSWIVAVLIAILRADRRP